MSEQKDYWICWQNPDWKTPFKKGPMDKELATKEGIKQIGKKAMIWLEDAEGGKTLLQMNFGG